jgi:hypothetical protein
MSTIHRSRSRVFGLATMFACTLLAPGAVSAQEEVADTAQQDVAVLAPVAAPALASTSADDVRAARALAAERALQSGDIGSMQEDRLLAIVAAAPSWDEISGYGAVEASRAINAMSAAPDASTSAEQTRLLAAQHALQSGDLGSLQEDTLLAVAAAGQSWDQISGYGSVEASRAANAIPVAPVANTTAGANRVVAAQLGLLSQDLGSLQEEALTAVVEASRAEVDANVDDGPAPTAAELLAQFRAIELALSRDLGVN